MKAISFRAVSREKYEAGIVDWAKEGLKVMHRKTRKLMTIYRALHLKVDVYPQFIYDPFHISFHHRRMC